VRAEVLHEKVWEILAIICERTPVQEELDCSLEEAAAVEPNEHYANEIAEKKKRLSANMEKQGGLYELYKGDGMSLEFYKEKASELRNEEKALKVQIRQLQLTMLDRERGLDERLRAQHFLCSLRDRGYQ